MNEDQLEQLCLEWFIETGWQVQYGPDIAHDCKSYDDAIGMIKLK